MHIVCACVSSLYANNLLSGELGNRLKNTPTERGIYDMTINNDLAFIPLYKQVSAWRLNYACKLVGENQ